MASPKYDRRKSKKKRTEDSDEQESSDDELTYKRKKKKSRQTADTNSDSDSDDGWHRRKSRSTKRSPSLELSFDEVGGSVYRAVREERISLGWSQAPCSTCPSFDFCKSGGPVNAQECVYYGDWLTGGTVAAIEDVIA